MIINQLNFLVIEDNDFQRNVVINMLQAMGIKSINESANGQHALEVMRTEKGAAVDIVLCDLSMPEMDGMEFLRHFGQLDHKASIILLSALGIKLLNSVGNMTQTYGVELLGVIEKPLDQATLEELLLNSIPKNQ